MSYDYVEMYIPKPGDNDDDDDDDKLDLDKEAYIKELIMYDDRLDKEYTIIEKSYKSIMRVIDVDDIIISDFGGSELSMPGGDKDESSLYREKDIPELESLITARKTELNMLERFIRDMIKRVENLLLLSQ